MLTSLFFSAFFTAWSSLMILLLEAFFGLELLDCVLLALRGFDWTLTLVVTAFPPSLPSLVSSDRGSSGDFRFKFNREAKKAIESIKDSYRGRNTSAQRGLLVQPIIISRRFGGLQRKRENWNGDGVELDSSKGV
nr:hypothetical protein Iba_chr13cCG13350 [Ipomoea batatas]